MKFKIFFLFFIYFYSFFANATNIRVIDINFIIDNQTNLKELLSKIKNDQLIYKDKFKNNELVLQSKLLKIDELKLILENTELQKEIDKYNDHLNKFNIELDKFNNHYEEQINDLRTLILNKALDILKKYSSDNQIDLILDSNNYILSSNTINITNLVLDELNNIVFEISFEKFE